MTRPMSRGSPATSLPKSSRIAPAHGSPRPIPSGLEGSGRAVRGGRLPGPDGRAAAPDVGPPAAGRPGRTGACGSRPGVMWRHHGPARGRPSFEAERASPGAMRRAGTARNRAPPELVLGAEGRALKKVLFVVQGSCPRFRSNGLKKVHIISARCALPPLIREAGMCGGHRRDPGSGKSTSTMVEVCGSKAPAGRPPGFLRAET